MFISLPLGWLDSLFAHFFFNPCKTDEILVNAADNFQRDPKMSMIKVDIDVSQNMISVWNNGKGIPITIHKEHNCYVPEMIFGKFLLSQLLANTAANHPSLFFFFSRATFDFEQLQRSGVEGDGWKEWLRCQAG